MCRYEKNRLTVLDKWEKSDDLITSIDHDFDAFVCCCAGADFVSGKCVPPPNYEKNIITKEGWIWVKTQEPPPASI